MEKIQKSFEEIKMTDETWFESWSARDLMKVLWYKEWKKFEWVLEKAKGSCEKLETTFLTILSEPTKW